MISLDKMTDEQIAAEVEKLRRSMIHGSTYRERFALDIIEMFTEGKTKAQFSAKHEICAATFDNWVKKHKLFAVAYTKAHECARAYYDNMRDRHLECETIIDDEGAQQPVKRLTWNAFNKMYNVRFNVQDKRSVKVKGFGTAKTESRMLQIINKGVESGELTPDEASKLGGLIGTSLDVKEMQGLEDRMTALETAKPVTT